MRALTELPRATLRAAIDALRTHGPDEVTRTALLAAGVEDPDALDELEAQPAPARVPVLQALLAAREAHAARAPALVWTGPEAQHDTARRTSQLIGELFDSAQRHVLISGYALDGTSGLLARLHARMVAGVRADLYLSVEQASGPGGPRPMSDDELASAASRHLAAAWPWSDVRPRVLVDARLREGRLYCSVHAKCVVVDASRALVTSANLTSRAMERNVEVGVDLPDPRFAAELVETFDAARRAGQFVEVEVGGGAR